MKTKNRGVILLTWIMLWMLLVPILPMHQANAATPGQISLNLGETLGPQYSNYKKTQDIFAMGAIDIWHYSGGYWMYDSYVIPDGVLKDNIRRNLLPEILARVGEPGICLGYMDMPTSVRTALNEGKNVIVNVKTSVGLPISEFIQNSTDVSKHKLVNTGSRLEFYSKPSFNFQFDDRGRAYTIQDFGLDNFIKLPFIKDGFGQNGWSIYNDEGGRPYATEGWASFSSWQDWNEFGGTKISYQKMLPNSSGRLYPGFNIETMVKPFGRLYAPQTYPSKDIGVGDIGNFKSGGSTGLRFFYPFQYEFYIEGDKIKEDVILTNLSVYEKDTSKPGNLGTKVGEFKREITNPLDPLNPANQVISATSVGPHDAFALQKDKDYVVKSTYQFISFLSGGFNINNPASMSSAQKAITTNKKGNQLTSAEAYDAKAFLSGVFDKEKTLVGENFGLLNLANNKTETFVWDFKFDNTKNQYVKIAGFIPEGFFTDNKNSNPLNDWGALYGKVESADMGLKTLKLFDELGNPALYFEPGKNYTANVIVTNESDTLTVGTNATTNPKAIVSYTVTDTSKTLLSNNKKQSTELLSPNSEVVMPKTDKFSTNSDTLKVCATIDAIHQSLGYNNFAPNDTLCGEFKTSASAKTGTNDLGVTDLILYNEFNNSVKYIEPNKTYKANVIVTHVAGTDAIGTNPITNPKVKVDYQVMEIGNKVIFPTNSKQASYLLHPGGFTIMPTSDGFSSSEGFIKVCARINATHKDLGYNFDESNDIVCKEFGMIKNYAVSSFASNPSSINFAKNQYVMSNHPVRFNFTISNEAITGLPEVLSSAILTQIKYNNTVIWNQVLSIPAGSTVAFTAETLVNLVPGDNSFSIEVNPNRTEKEFKPGMSDPYSDNFRNLSILGTVYEECQECMTTAVRSSNNWTEEWSWYEQEGVVKTGTFSACNGYGDETVTYCAKSETVGTDWGCIDGENVTTSECTNEKEVTVSKYIGETWHEGWRHVEWIKQPAPLYGYNEYSDWGWYSLPEYETHTETRCLATKSTTTYVCHEEGYKGSKSECVDERSYTQSVCNSYKTETYEYCEVTWSDSDEKEESYYEEYRISNVFFGSKLNEDTTGSRFVSIADGGYANIKAGFGFELNVETTYKTDRNIAPSPYPYNSNSYTGKGGGVSYCNYRTRSPGVTPVNAPTRIYVEMPYANQNNNVCYILKDYLDNGTPWYNLRRTFMLPERKTPTGTVERRIYISEGTQPNNESGKTKYPIKIVTPRPDKPDAFYGYEPEAMVTKAGYTIKQPQNKVTNGSYLHDCHTIYVLVHPNNDVNTHIIQ